ncbi:hypothetical protein HPP92_025592 [Vanilla planifolia]|uniref:Beta-amylase n=1 Tax=Vanilla planifolia TaxID=51239 RepID=A0A835PKA8_VANPL|nr:hypothetical protein HPP92_025592 [Vanilla planifolia]
MLASLKLPPSPPAIPSGAMAGHPMPLGTTVGPRMPLLPPRWRWLALPHGEFFLSWYSGLLLQHGDKVLSAAAAVFHGTGTKISVKVAGIHWHYGTRSHAAELTAGYYNTYFRNGYMPIAEMIGRHGRCSTSPAWR